MKDTPKADVSRNALLMCSLPKIPNLSLTKLPQWASKSLSKKPALWLRMRTLKLKNLLAKDHQEQKKDSHMCHHPTRLHQQVVHHLLLHLAHLRQVKVVHLHQKPLHILHIQSKSQLKNVRSQQVRPQHKRTHQKTKPNKWSKQSQWSPNSKKWHHCSA